MTKNLFLGIDISTTGAKALLMDATGEVVTVRQVMDDGVRALVVGRGDEELMCDLAPSLRRTVIRAGAVRKLSTYTRSSTSS